MKKLLLVLFTIYLISFNLSSQIMTTFYEGSTMEYITSIASDSIGNIYYSDYLGHRIRKIEINTREVFTVAGNGVSGYSGDGGLANNACLNNPMGITIDRAHKLYIADGDNHVVRKVNLYYTVKMKPNRNKIIFQPQVFLGNFLGSKTVKK